MVSDKKDEQDQGQAVSRPEPTRGTFTIVKAIKEGRRFSRVKGGWYFEPADKTTLDADKTTLD